MNSLFILLVALGGLMGFTVCALLGYGLGLRDGEKAGYAKGYREGYLRSARS